MARADRCPICNVSVKPENLLRHLNDIHPRHPDTPRLREELKADIARAPRPRSSAAPFHLKTWHVALVALIVAGGIGGFYLSQAASGPPNGAVFPCVAGENYVYHWHTQLIVHSGEAIYPIPANIGIIGTCLQPVHTHESGGQLHIETTVDRLYSIGDFYRIWGKPFGSPTQMLVDGTTITPDPNTILRNAETLHIFYDSFQ